jgi:hypothetical protein
VHHLVLAGGELIHGLCQRGETLLTGGELLNAFLQRCETLDHLLHLYRVEGRGGGRFRGDCLSLGDGCRYRPAKQTRDFLLRRVPVRLPSQGGGNTNTDRDRVACEPSRASLFRLVFYRLERMRNRRPFRILVVVVTTDLREQVLPSSSNFR